MRKAVKRSAKLAREIDAWQRKLQPRLSDIDPHDLNLILWSILRPKYGGQRRLFLRRRNGGGYVY